MFSNNEKAKSVVSVKEILIKHSTNKTTQWEWLSGNYDFTDYHSILEIGGGDGLFWTHHANKLTPNHVVFLTDIDEKRISKSKDVLSKVKTEASFQYSQKNIDEAPKDEEKGKYDAVLAHSVLYLCQNPTKALCHSYSMVKPEKLLSFTVLEDGAGANLFRMTKDVEKDMGIEEPDFVVPEKCITDNYAESHANTDVAENFGNYKTNRYANKLTFRESQPVIELYKSYPNVPVSKIPDKFFTKLQEKIDDVIEEENEFSIEYNLVQYSVAKPRMK